MAAVEKEAVLAMVEQMEEEEEKKEVLAHPEGSALLCAHDENVSAWIEAIQQWLRMSAAQSVSLADLYNHLKMPWIEVWMGVLLGSFELEQQGELYRTSVWVKMR